MGMHLAESISAFLDRVLARLARVTSSGAFYPEVDGLRAIAIIAVVAFHVQKYVVHATPAPDSHTLSDTLVRSTLYAAGKGFFGVELFFVISGFILSLPFATHYLRQGRKPSLARYYQRRLLRLEPPYIISLLLCFALLVVHYGGAAEPLLPHLGASLVYVRQLLLGGDNPINGVLWSLECEVQFYVLAPLLATLFLIRNTALRRLCLLAIPLAALCAANVHGLLVKAPQLGDWPLLGAGLKAFAPVSLVLERILLIHYTGYFCAGFLLADVFVASWNEKPIQHWTWDFIGLSAWLTLLFLVPTNTKLFMAIGATLPFPLLIFLAYMAAFRGPLSNRILRNRWMVTIGGMCYTEYLYHQVVLHLVQDRLGLITQSILLQIPMFLALTVAFSAVLFVLFEKPFMYKDWHRNALAWFGGLRAPAPVDR